ncbi:MAG: DUF3106 domain-containing protein [Verrucomicrobia bacterium]|nr:DUF3106 domain-containing protein [Verrucomicrobiota bacterium]
MKLWKTFPATGLRKSFSLWLLFVIFSTAVSLIGADEKKNSKESNEDLTTLQQLLKMPKEDLKRVRLTLETIENMSPTDRKKALQRIQNLNKMPTEQRKETIARWNELSPDLKKAYFDHLRKLSASERKKFKELPWDKQIEQVKKAIKK